MPLLMDPSRMWGKAALFVALAFSSSLAAPSDFVSFGIITDVHYADADSIGDRIYRDSLPKVVQATSDISAAKADFLIELGDFKDTDVTQHCDKAPSEHCTNLTLGACACACACA